MAEGKWISALKPGTSLVAAARRVLSIRLEVVRDFLGLARGKPYQDPEHVHQLRVGIRRSRAALDIFAVCLPPKAYERARKHLRRIRRAAGAARDWDVFLAELSSPPRARARDKAAIDFLVGHAVAQRLTAQEQLEEASPEYPFDFERLQADVLSGIQKPEHHLHTLGDLARPLFGDLLDELRRAAADNLEDYDHLHQVRILGKRLRYAMEIFVDCFKPFFRETLYPAVEEMQDILGRANDSHVAGQRLEGLRAKLDFIRPADGKRFGPGIERLVSLHEERLLEERQHFVEWWARWRDSLQETVFFSLLKPMRVRTGRGRSDPVSAS